MNVLRKWWYRRLRRIDLEILWPCCKQKAKDLDTAKAVFAVHAMNDRAWLFLGEEQICKFIDGLR